MSPFVMWGLVAVVGLGLIRGVAYVVDRLVRRWRNSHSWLFCSLCRLHRLERGSRRLLRQVAQHYRLAQPGRLFTEPQWLDPARLTGALRSRSAEVESLARRLFG